MLALALLMTSACRRAAPSDTGANATDAGLGAGTLRAETYLVGGATHQGVVFEPPQRGPKPAVLLFDPGGNAQAAVERWAPAAREAGWLVASTPEVRNGTPDESDTREMLGLLSALRVDFEVDPARVYTAGVSGGGCGAYLLAIMHSDVFAGAFVQVSHMASWREYDLASRPARSEQRFYVFTRHEDFNRKHSGDLAQAMRLAGFGVTLVEEPGGHEGMRDAEIRTAIAWMGRAQR